LANTNLPFGKGDSEMENHTIRVLVAKPGLDGHDRGALVVAQSLRDAGMEVIYTGLRQTPEQIAAVAVQEDVDCVGLSSLSGAHMQLFPEVVNQLQRLGADDILVIGGGVIPNEDIEQLQQCGIRCVFTPGTPISSIADFIRKNVHRKAYTVNPNVTDTNSGNVEKNETLHVGMQDYLASPTVPDEITHIKPTQLDHIGIAVHKTEDVLAFYTQHLGMNVVHEETVEDQQVHVTFVQLQDTMLELLEPIHVDSPIAAFLAKRGPGLHHIAYRVSDIEAALLEAKALGYRLIDETPRRGAHGKRIAFLHPKQTGGVLTELCQKIEQEETNGK
jgi:methylmalonyl-CoA mutase, C-terminal domain